jgi:hypothetical protein
LHSPDVAVQLYQYGQENILNSYFTESDGRLTGCHFDSYCARFGASDSRGSIFLWKFDTDPSSMKPASIIESCHKGPVNEFCFLNSSSIIATAGMSSTTMNIGIWDTLLPKRKVKSI